MKHFLQPAGIEPLSWKQADNSLMLIQMVSAGMGVAALPNWAVDNFVHQGLIVSKPLGKGLWRRLFAAVRASEHQHQYLKAFLPQRSNNASSIYKVLKQFNTLLE